MNVTSRPIAGVLAAAGKRVDIELVATPRIVGSWTELSARSRTSVGRAVYRDDTLEGIVAGGRWISAADQHAMTIVDVGSDFAEWSDHYANRFFVKPLNAAPDGSGTVRPGINMHATPVRELEVEHTSPIRAVVHGSNTVFARAEDTEMLDMAARMNLEVRPLHTYDNYTGRGARDEATDLVDRGYWWVMNKLDPRIERGGRVTG